MTNFPEKIKITTIDKKSIIPLSGILLTIRLFATRKNDYYITTELSDENGEILVTKQTLEQEIDRDRNMYIMDYASLLKDCKPYIEIEAEGAETLAKRIAGMEEYIPFFPENIKNIQNAKASSNWKIIERKETVKINEGKELQEITFELELKE